MAKTIKLKSAPLIARTTNKMPKIGQFVAIWMHEGRLWSGTFENQNNKLCCYDSETDDFRNAAGYNSVLQNATFIQLKGGDSHD